MVAFRYDLLVIKNSKLAKLRNALVLYEKIGE